MSFRRQMPIVTLYLFVSKFVMIFFKRVLLCFILLLPNYSAFSQEEIDTNIQLYTPSVLFQTGQWEYKFFNNLYTQTKGFDTKGNISEYNSRGTYFTSINQFLYGVSSKINVGADVWIKSVRIDSVNSSPAAILKFENSHGARTAVAAAGPKIKIAPFGKIPNLSVQSAFLIPVANDLEGKSNGKPFLSNDSYLLLTQIFYDKPLGAKYKLFFQFAPWIYYKKERTAHTIDKWNYTNPVDVFFCFFPTKLITFYFQEEFWPTFGSNGISSFFRQEGIGLKVQIIKGLMEAELLYTKFTMGKNAGAGETFNLGIRFIRW